VKVVRCWLITPKDDFCEQSIFGAALLHFTHLKVLVFNGTTEHFESSS
jgi:hypothetical protein